MARLRAFDSEINRVNFMAFRSAGAMKNGCFTVVVEEETKESLMSNFKESLHDGFSDLFCGFFSPMRERERVRDSARSFYTKK